MRAFEWHFLAARRVPNSVAQLEGLRYGFVILTFPILMIMGRYLEKPPASNIRRFDKLSDHEFSEIPIMIL
jgi:hypothetical protein